MALLFREADICAYIPCAIILSYLSVTSTTPTKFAVLALTQTWMVPTSSAISITSSTKPIIKSVKFKEGLVQSVIDSKFTTAGG